MDCLDLGSMDGAGFLPMDPGAMYGLSCFAILPISATRGSLGTWSGDDSKAGGAIETVPRSFGSRLCKGTTRLVRAFCRDFPRFLEHQALQLFEKIAQN